MGLFLQKTLACKGGPPERPGSVKAQGPDAERVIRR
jgi:hypothetical protein